jgi:cytochrome c biogenesis protein CcmG/thiol:disulfide interchange protein DsbE
MSHRVRVVLIGALAALVLVGCSSEAAAPKQKKSDGLPDVTLSALESGPGVELASLRGPMVVNLWASWCAPCVRELPLYQAFSEKYAGKVDVVGIDFQETRAEAAQELANDSGVRYPLYADPDGELRAIGLPKVILVDEQGSVAYEEYVEITSVAQIERLVAKHLGVSS